MNRAGKADFDGSNPEIVATGFVQPAGIDFIPEPSSLALLAACAMLRRRGVH